MGGGTGSFCPLAKKPALPFDRSEHGGRLSALIKSDELVEHTARAVVARLDTSPLSNVVEIQTLRIAIR